MTDLPRGWATAEIGDLLYGITAGKNLKCEERPPQAHERGVIKVSAVTWGTFDASQSKTLPTSFQPVPETRIKAGDFLFSRANTLELVGAVVMVRDDHPNLYLSDKVLRLDFPPELKPWLLVYLRSLEGRRKLGEVSSGNQMSMRNIGQSSLKTVLIPLPPLNEQRRIVEKIEAMFDEIDKGVESLQTARATLGLYRQSLLKSAFEGRLTADWRVQNADKLEAPDKLLERAECERDKWHRTAFEEWSEVVEGWKAAGSKGPKPRRPEVYKQSEPLAAEELGLLPEIPEEWIFLRLNDIAAIGSGMSVSKSRKLDDPVEVPYLRVANVQRGFLDLDEIKTMEIERSQADALGLATWDILFNEGGDRDKLGRGWVWENQVPNCITQNHVFRASPFRHDLTWSQFISHWGNSFGRDYFEKGGKQTTNLASINKTVLKALPVPYCSPDEQAEIVRLLDEKLEAAAALEVEIDAALARANALRQSILKKAFSGQLVPQDPNDEPASALLERIKADRARASKAPGKRKATA